MPVFVVHEHNARNLHYDFRLELNGKLKSWAMRKIPPRRAGLKRLAIETEDHRLPYAKFEGEIKEGYGKGTVKIWDSGSYGMKSNKKEKLVFELKGKKLNGTYVILRFKRAGPRQWIFFRKKAE